MASDKAMLEEILADAYGEDEQLWAFRQVFEDAALMPAEGIVIGEAVSVTKINYDGNTHRKPRATCKKVNGSHLKGGDGGYRVFGGGLISCSRISTSTR